MYNSAESRAKKKPSAQLAHIQREWCKGCPNGSSVVLPNELLQCFPAAGGQRVMVQEEGLGAVCMQEACKHPSQLR